jgi:hypothetical protein
MTVETYLDVFHNMIYFINHSGSFVGADPVSIREAANEETVDLVTAIPSETQRITKKAHAMYEAVAFILDPIVRN